MLKFHRRPYRKPDDDMGGGGGTPVAEAPAAVAPAEPAAPVAAEAAPAAPAADQPKDMLDAINRHFERDEAGRFKAKQEADAAAALQGKPPAEKPAAPAEPEDVTAMPEGLGAKAQERFQKLAGTVKEVSLERDQARQEVAQVREYLQQHRVTPQQFEQAVGVLGMLNGGDLEGALRVLDQQRQQIALALGKPLPGVDGLASFPDLRERVDKFEMDEGSAYELARSRAQQQAQQRAQQQYEQQHQQAQQSQQAFTRAQMEVDALTKQLAASDIDYPVIEEQLLPDLPALLRDVPPNAWANVVKAQYGILKRAAATFRRPAPGAMNTDSNPLRATGGGSPQQRPRDAYEAMWGKPAPTGM